MRLVKGPIVKLFHIKWAFNLGSLVNANPTEARVLCFVLYEKNTSGRKYCRDGSLLGFNSALQLPLGPLSFRN